jgi:hypothetical protein
VSKHLIDDGFTITVNLEVPEKTIIPAELRLIQAHLGELLQHVIRETETEE